MSHRPRSRHTGLAAAGSALLALALGAAFVALVHPAPPDLWRRLDFNGAPFEDFIGPYFETARALPGAALPAPGYHYPALLALLLAPLARLGPAVASYAWLALELAATALVVALPLILCPPRSLRERLVYCAAAGLAHPLLHNLYWGQVSAPLAALLLLAAWAAQRGWPKRAGALIGAAAALKLTPGLFLLGPLVRRERRTVVWGAAVAAGLAVLPAMLALGPARAWSFHREVCERLAALARSAATPVGGRGSQDTTAVLLRWTGADAAALPRLAGVALAAALVWRLRRVRDSGLVFAHLALLAPLLVAPTWSHGLAALPAAAWFVWRAPAANRLCRGAAVCAAALTSLPVHALFESPEQHASAGVGGAAVLLLAAALALRSADAGTGPAEVRD